MFALFAYFVAAVVIFSLLMPKPQLEDARAGRLGDLSFPRAAEGDPIALVYGTTRLRGPNTLWYGDFRAEAITKKVKTGLFSSKRVTVGYKYYVGMDLALCLGPVTLSKFWAGKDLVWTGGMAGEGDFYVNKPSLYGGEDRSGGLQGTVTFYPGDFTQSRDPYLATHCDPNVPRYGGLAHVVFKDFYIGTQLSLRPFSFEVSRTTNSLGLTAGIAHNGTDVNPVELMYDALTGGWGRLGMDPDLIDLTSWQAAANTLAGEYNWMSLAIQASNAGNVITEEVLRQIDGILYQDPDAGKIKIKLIRKDYDVNTLPVLDVTNVEDVQTFSKTTWDGTYNQARVKFRNRTKDYVDGTAMAQDFANVNFQQRVKSTEVSMPGVTNGGLANRLAARVLASVSVPLYRAELHCTRAASFLRPGDPFVFKWDPFGITLMVMRVQRVQLGTLQDGGVVVECIQDQFASDTLVFATPEESAWVPTTIEASPVTVRKVFEAPYFFQPLSGAALPDRYGLLWAGGRAPSGFSQAYSAEVSDDNFSSDPSVGLDTQLYTGSARLVNAYDASVAADDRYDTTTGITIDLLQGDYALNNLTRSGQTEGGALFVLNGELMSYGGFTDNLDGTYTLNNISRGVLDTVPETHAAGDYLWFIYGAEALCELELGDLTNWYVRLLDETHSATLDPTLAAVDQVQFAARAFRPLPPAYLTLEGSRTPAATSGATSITAEWRERNRLSGSIAWYDDPTQTPEVGTTYTVETNLSGAGWVQEAAGLSTPSRVIDVTALTGTLEVRVWAVRDNYQSRVADYCTIVLA